MGVKIVQNGVKSFSGDKHISEVRTWNPLELYNDQILTHLFPMPSFSTP